MKILLLGNSGSGKDFAADLFELCANLYEIKRAGITRGPAKKGMIKRIIRSYNTDVLKRYGFGIFQTKRFAQPIKDFIHKTYRIPYTILNSSVKNNYKININGEQKTLRQLLIELSEEFKKILGNDVWVNAMFRGPMKENTIIVDGRFPNEFHKAKKEGFISVKIKSANENKSDFGINKLNEIPEYMIDYVLENNESELSLFRKIYRIYETEFEKENDNDKDLVLTK